MQTSMQTHFRMFRDLWCFINIGDAKMRSPCLREPVRVFLPLLLLYALDAHGQTVEIVSPRPPISFPVGTNITFQCEATGSRSALWEVNTIQLAGPTTRGAFATRGIITEPGPMLPAIGDISYTLYALASFENNRTVITCQASASVLSSFVSSDDVTLLVFGLPNPPIGLSSSSQAANTLRLQWEAPFSLPGENISYILHTRNLRTDETMNGVTVSGTSTTFERPQEDQACDRYEFTVYSNNAVGPSENCTAVEASTPSAPQRLDGLNVSLTMEGGLAVTMSFSALSCPDYPVTNYSAILILPEGIPQRLGPFLPSGNNPETVTITGADGLLEDRMYTASVEGRNQFGRTTSEARTIYTTDVQSASVKVEGDNVTITCTFLSGSNAQGCRVEFTVSSSPTPLWTGNILRENNSNTVERVETIELPAENNYLVSVRDFEVNGSVGQTALSATVNVIPTIATTTLQGTTFSTEPPSTTATASTSVGLAIGLSIFFAILAAVLVVIITVLVTCMYLRQNSKLNGNKMWLRAGRRNQSKTRGINNDSRSIVIEANICYDSTAFNNHHDEEFHEYDVVNRNTSVQYENFDQCMNTLGPVASSAHDSVFGDHQNEDNINQGTSASGKGQPSSSQCDSGNRMSALLASSVHLTDSEAPREDEILVHSNSAYEIRDTPNDYEN